MEDKNKTKLKKRLVNFDFFRVCVFEDEKNHKLYDMLSLLNYINKLKLEDRNLIIQGEQARLSKIILHQDKPYELFQLNLCRLREDTPAIATTISSELSNIPLEENEYIAEDINILYDNGHHVLMVQRNIHSLSASGLQVYFQNMLEQMDPDNSLTISLEPLLDINVLKKAKSKDLYRKVTLRVATNKVGQLLEDPIERSFEQLKSIEGATMEITISANSGKKSKLKTSEIRKIIESIEQERELYSKAEVSGKDNEDSTIEKFDLLKGKLRVQKFYDVPIRQYLNPETVLDDITTSYIRKYRDEVVKNLM
ncbi:TPA: hypothetical protein RD852_000723 [Listeria monocytogenes]|uniref:DUF6731 family protein n=1 Tax=Listeria TaxID=1637 RepID=UPI000BDFA582|nr:MULTISPECIES: DUF6731 family protein [Listeria]EAC5079593.1 hypothetical protein [Listeria monocytogenes]EAC6159077.1 hypothetical protein [Listeria monocytogenes]EAC7675211.1 hypothetical protein [Listeria monocytogenes]EAC7684168.1 hypothetical protein [Listeria monocytogenes]EAC7838746.1 hypothetical protein [Listeria monocytogenes]